MARPKKEIDKASFESLLKMQCTLEEVAGFFNDKLNGCSEDTIERWCKRTYGESFADISKKWRAVGKISLRRYQLKLAENNASMAIWLGKQYLGQCDAPPVSVAPGDVHEDALSKSLKELATELESD